MIEEERTKPHHARQLLTSDWTLSLEAFYTANATGIDTTKTEASAVRAQPTELYSTPPKEVITVQHKHSSPSESEHNLPGV